MSQSKSWVMCSQLDAQVTGGLTVSISRGAKRRRLDAVVPPSMGALQMG